MQVQDSNIFRHYLAASVERDGLVLFYLFFLLAGDSLVNTGESRVHVTGYSRGGKNGGSGLVKNWFGLDCMCRFRLAQNTFIQSLKFHT